MRRKPGGNSGKVNRKTYVIGFAALSLQLL